MFKVERLRILREANGLTQQQVADHVSTTQRNYSRYENGERAVPINIIVALCDFYGVSVDYMLGLSDKTERLY